MSTFAVTNLSPRRTEMQQNDKQQTKTTKQEHTPVTLTRCSLLHFFTAQRCFIGIVFFLKGQSPLLTRKWSKALSRIRVGNDLFTVFKTTHGPIVSLHFSLIYQTSHVFSAGGFFCSSDGTNINFNLSHVFKLGQTHSSLHFIFKLCTQGLA